MTIKEIIDKINSGDYNGISRDELILLAKSANEASSGKADPNAEKWKGLDATNLAGEMQKALEEMRNSPQGQEHIKEAVINSRSTRFTAQYGPFFKALLAGGDIATSLNQISAANRGIAALRRPNIPSPTGIDPSLNGAIRQAEQGVSTAPTAGNVAKSDIFDQYLQDIRNASIAGGGQQSTFGALAQGASAQRNKALARLLPMTNDIQMQRQRQLNELIMARQGFANQQFGQNLQSTGMALDQYNRDAIAAGSLGATGRSNLRQTLGGVSDLMPQLGARLYPVTNPFIKGQQSAPVQSSTQPGVYNPKYNEYDDIVTNNLANHIALRKSMATDEDPYYNPNIRY